MCSVCVHEPYSRTVGKLVVQSNMIENQRRGEGRAPGPIVNVELLTYYMSVGNYQL